MAISKEWCSCSRKEFNDYLHVAFFMSRERTLVIFFNALVDWLWARKISFDMGDLKELAAQFNRYDAYFEDDIITADQYLENFEKWTGISINWHAEKNIDPKTIARLIRAGYYDEAIKKQEELKKKYDLK